MMRPLEELPEMMRVADACQALDVSRRTLYRIIEEGGIGYVKVSERGIRISRQQVAAYLAKRTFEPEEVTA